MRSFLFKAGFILFLGLLFLSCGNKNPVNSLQPPHIPEQPFFAAIDYDPAWSPDGQTIAYAHGATSFAAGGIFLIHPSGGHKQQLVPGLARGPTWSPDGRWIAFEDRARIFKIKTNGDSLTQLTFTGRNFSPSWSPDGKWVAYWKSTPVADNGIWISPIDGSGTKKYFTFGAGPDWEPDSNEILYGNRGLWIESLDHSLKRNIFSDHQNVLRSPRYSPDGSRIAFTSQRLGNKYFISQIWIMKADGSGLYQLTDSGGYTCDWSPDGQWIVYTDPRPENGRLWLVRSTIGIYNIRWKWQLTF